MTSFYRSSITIEQLAQEIGHVRKDGTSSHTPVVVGHGESLSLEWLPHSPALLYVRHASQERDQSHPSFLLTLDDGPSRSQDVDTHRRGPSLAWAHAQAGRASIDATLAEMSPALDSDRLHLGSTLSSESALLSSLLPASALLVLERSALAYSSSHVKI